MLAARTRTLHSYAAYGEPARDMENAMTATDVPALGASLKGRLLLPGDAGYDDAREPWNALVRRRPSAVVCAADVDDVCAAVRFAATHDLAVTVRGGGHHVAGHAAANGVLMIHLGDMRRVDVDAKARTARVQGGATLADLDAATQAHGLATPGGVVSSTGIGGLTLGGGFGWLSRQFGLSVDNLQSVELVTADGTVHVVDANREPDLFWGLRGGGGNFGVATSFEFRLHPVGPEIRFGPTFYRLADAPAALRRFRAFADTAPRACCVWADLMTAPPVPVIPAADHGTPVLALMQCWTGDPARADDVLAPLHAGGSPLGSAFGPMRYVDAQRFLDATYEKGLRNYWKSGNFVDLSDAAIDWLVEVSASMPTPESDMLISTLGGAIDDVTPSATAYPHRGTQFVVAPGARWQDAADDARCLAWIDTIGRQLAHHADTGAYVNFIAEPDGRERDAYGGNLERLAALKARHDPHNRFRANRNVRPATR